jgi:hypothetical protein
MASNRPRLLNAGLQLVKEAFYGFPDRSTTAKATPLLPH